MTGFQKALWVTSDRISTRTAIDELLADSVSWNVRDLIVRVGGGGAARDDFDPFAHLLRGGAAVGVRIHAWANAPFGRSSDTVEGLADLATRYAVEGLQYDQIGDPITELVRDASAALRRARPGIVLSATIDPDPSGTADRVLQRWPEWAAEGLLDLLCPMAYGPNDAVVARSLSLARAAAPATRMWGGLMAYPGLRERVRAQVRAARDSGCEGAILFAYDPAQRDVIDAFAAEAER